MNEHIDSTTLLDYLHGELTPEHDAAIHVHLAACASCALARDAEASLTERLRAEALAAERDVPPGVAARVRARLDPVQPHWFTGLRALLRPAIGLPVAAVLVLAIVLGLTSLHMTASKAPAIAAAYYLDDHASLSTRALPFTQTSVVPEALQTGGAVRMQTAAVGTNTIASE